MKKMMLLLLCLTLGLTLLPFSVAAVEAVSLPIPILMYHHIAEMETYNSMTISPQRFREDMIFLRDNGFTPLFPDDVAEIMAGKMKMPLRPVMITFDDGYESNYTYAFPILQETGMKATISVIAQSIRPTAEKQLWTMTWAQCVEMYESGLVIFGSHTANLHNANNGGNYRQGGPNGIERLPGETQAQYNQRVGSDLYRSVSIIKSYLGYTPTFFAYPFGVSDPWVYPLLERYGITMTVTTTTRVADVSEGVLDMPRLLVTMSTPVSRLLADFSPQITEGTTSYIAASVNGRMSYLPSVLIGDTHYVRLSGIAGMLAKTPAAFTFDDSLTLERIPYGKAWYNEIIPGSSVAVSVTRRTLILEGKGYDFVCLEENREVLFCLEELAPLLGFLCTTTLSAAQSNHGAAVYAITFPG